MNIVHSIQNAQKAEAYYVSRLTLTNFRNYVSQSLELAASPVVLTGRNGSGKTNILEAVSFLSPGRGLRSVKLDEADRIDGDSAYPWGVAAKVSCGDDEIMVGTGRDAASSANKRIVKIDGNIVRGQTDLARVFSVMWQTPQMDGLFIGSTSDRRKFLDRLVYNFDPEHASRIYSYEYSMRERAKLLQSGGDGKWVAVLENKLAEQAVAIAIARLDAVQLIQKAINLSETAFPKADIGIDGSVEQKAVGLSALQLEEDLRRQFFDTRRYDAATGRTSVGTHRSDFAVKHREKNMPAASCSTGEQKALLLSIILAEARAKAMWKNSMPVMLLDEVVAHLDEGRRNDLFEEIVSMGMQVWMTGTDIELFRELEGKAQFFGVNGGRVG